MTNISDPVACVPGGANPPIRTLDPRRLARALALLLPLLMLALVVAGSPSQSKVAAARSLEVGPEVYVAGQAVTFTGALGRSGRQSIWLQFNMNRPGDVWTDVEGFRTTTDANGRFSFTHPAPAMFNISYRVASKYAVSPAWLSRARSQEVALSVDAQVPRVAAGKVIAGQPFVVTADTTPALRGAGLNLTPPAFPGRTVTLQRRVSGDAWSTVATGTTDSLGVATFTLTEPTTGVQVYRAREEDWFEGANRIGWFASFPAYVDVISAVSRSAHASAVPTRRAVTTHRSRPATTTMPAPRGASTNASSRYRWGRSLFDFAWEYGESLTSPPARGTNLRGGWSDTSDGSGRAAHFNGGLALQSQFNHGGPGDHGTTAVTLHGNAQTTGRWEFRLRATTAEGNARPYGARIELVPTDAGDACSDRTITVADLTVNRQGLRFGVSSPAANASWTRTLPRITLNDTPRNVAVEVAPDHISWFYDGRVIGTVKDPGAMSTGNLTPRISLVGVGQEEMNTTSLISDWQRAWTLKGGTQVKNGAQLTRTTFQPHC